MNKILKSLSVIAFVGAVALAGTGAFFTDTETSTGNIFTAGAIDLKIDNESYAIDYTIPDYVGTPTGALVASTSNSWELNDLVDQLFFNFVDLKPGDFGEDTISLHVNSNDAWACMNINITATPENGVTEPEAIVDQTDGTDEGELQDELYFAFWADDGDNVYEVGEEIFKEGFAGAIFNGTSWALADSTTNVWEDTPNIPLIGGEGNSPVYHVGKVWCYGTLGLDAKAPEIQGTPLERGTGFTCNGAGVGNESQTDGIVADVEFYAEQSRNNPNFICGE